MINDKDHCTHLQEEEKRKKALKDAELERKKQHIDEEYQREKKRQEIRDKYGIQKKAQSSKDKQKVLDEMKKEYGMSDADARELQQKMCQVGIPVCKYLDLKIFIT